MQVCWVPSVPLKGIDKLCPGRGADCVPLTQANGNQER